MLTNGKTSFVWWTATKGHLLVCGMWHLCSNWRKKMCCSVEALRIQNSRIDEVLGYLLWSQCLVLVSSWEGVHLGERVFHFLQYSIRIPCFGFDVCFFTQVLNICLDYSFETLWSDDAFGEVQMHLHIMRLSVRLRFELRTEMTNCTIFCVVKAWN